MTYVTQIWDRQENDFWDDLPENIRRSINEAKAELDRGDGIRHERVMAEVKQRFLRKHLS